jgi:hypothetical protein
VFSIFVAAAIVMGWKLIVYELDHVFELGRPAVKPEAEEDWAR